MQVVLVEFVSIELPLNKWLMKELFVLDLIPLEGVDDFEVESMHDSWVGVFIGLVLKI